MDLEEIRCLDAKSYLIQSKAVTPLARKMEGVKNLRKIGDGPTMCMKTKENRSDKLTDPTMFMKTNGLIFVTHDVYEKQGT
jgi:hypothetical protein